MRTLIRSLDWSSALGDMGDHQLAPYQPLLRAIQRACDADDAVRARLQRARVELHWESSVTPSRDDPEPAEIWVILGRINGRPLHFYLNRYPWHAYVANGPLRRGIFDSIRGRKHRVLAVSDLPTDGAIDAWYLDAAALVVATIAANPTDD